MARRRTPQEIEQEERNALTARIREMHNYTERVCERLRMPVETQKAAQATASSIFGARVWFFFPVHSPEQREFLEMLLLLSLAHNPGLADRTRDLAWYLSANYGYEWVRTELTATVRRDALEFVTEGGAEWELTTELAPALAYARCHPRTLRLRTLSDHVALVEAARQVASARILEDRWPDLRSDLGLD
ncbi:MAG: hypothetical protein HPY44_20565 [Armatimonadetes bacterium]|nr:hypothetical protein [Armatimonadota bacterium]